MGEIQSVSNEIIRVSVGIIGLILTLGAVIAGVEAQVDHLLGRPSTHNYGGKMILLTLILGIAAISTSISGSIARALGF